MPTITWNNATPADDDDARNGAGHLRDTKTAVLERLALEHVFTSGNESDVGQHKLKNGLFANRPTAATAGKVYISIDRRIISLDLGGSWTDLPFPSGTKMVFFQATAPVGWTQDTTHNDKALRIVSGAGAGSGGSLDLSAATVGDHTLTTAEMPAHTHTFTLKDNDTDTQAFAAAGHPTTVNTGTTDSTGGGGAHNHTLALKYIDVIIATKD